MITEFGHPAAITNPKIVSLIVSLDLSSVWEGQELLSHFVPCWCYFPCTCIILCLAG